MVDRALYRFSIKIQSMDLAVVGCLRALAQFSQKTENNRIPWANTKDEDWKRDGKMVTFHFTSSAYRDGFEAEVKRLFDPKLWSAASRSDNDPARPA